VGFESEEGKGGGEDAIIRGERKWKGVLLTEALGTIRHEEGNFGE